jgi:predicted transcriptional regulator
MNVYIGFRVDLETKEELKKIADKRERSLSFVARKMIEEKLKELKENPNENNHKDN